jgi:hypothetical protein
LKRFFWGGLPAFSLLAEFERNQFGVEFV